MKKIIFSDDYGLTPAVLNKTKTMLRRSIMTLAIFNGKDICEHNVYTNSKGAQCIDLFDREWHIVGHWESMYEVSEIVAVAQPYKDIIEYLPMYSGIILDSNGKPLKEYKQGWDNSMFVEPNLMPHHIRITDVKVERLQDISDEDILCEGIRKVYDNKAHYYVYKYLSDGHIFYTSREAFTSLINKIMGEGIWDSNPWVVVYEFALID